MPKYYARKIPSGYSLHEGGSILPGDIPLTLSEYEALLDDRAQIINSKVVYHA